MSSALADGFFTTSSTWESQNLLLSTKTILRVEHFQNGLAQFAIDKQLIETSAFKCAFQVLESSAQKRVPGASGHSSLDIDNSSCWLQGVSRLWLWPNPHDHWHRLPHVTLVTLFPVMNATLITSIFVLILYITKFMSPMFMCLSAYMYMPRILMWKISTMKKIRVHFRQNVFH